VIHVCDEDNTLRGITAPDEGREVAEPIRGDVQAKALQVAPDVSSDEVLVERCGWMNRYIVEERKRSISLRHLLPFSAVLLVAATDYARRVTPAWQ
jgi:hypothetical protein